MFRAILKISAATLAFCVLHSVCASPPVKNAVRRVAGERHYRGWYRAFYTVQSVLSLGALLVYICTLPNRTLYHIRGKAAWLMRAGQIVSLLLQIHTAFQVGIGRITGADNLWAWLRGSTRLRPAAEGQGPSLDIYASGDKRLHLTGLFRKTRHPLNFFSLPLLWLQTPMTLRWAAFSALASLYFYAGSFIEAARLRKHYGAPYRDYERGDIRFFLPTPKATQSKKEHQDTPEDTI